MDIERTMFIAAFGLAAGASILFLSRLASDKRPLLLGAEALTFLYLAAMTVSLAARTVKSGHAPMSNRYESLACFAWSLGSVYWYVRLRYKEAR
ncbi:MAG TPA: hypothetical protein VGB23_06170, partial [Nitrospirota bacterium]